MAKKLEQLFVPSTQIRIPTVKTAPTSIGFAPLLRVPYFCRRKTIEHQRYDECKKIDNDSALHGKLHVVVGTRGQPPHPVGLAELHRLRLGTEHHHTQESPRRRECGGGCEDGQSSLVPKPFGFSEPAHREPSKQ